ncbi:MAG: cytochrome c oxidase subunit II, partial [Pseudomonadota bacterium]
VIHAWTIPAFGVKVDAIPGRMNELWFKAEEIGTYFGQCSELCGKDHSYMPITVRVVSQNDYEAWVNEIRTAQGNPPKYDVQLAAAE